MPLLEVDNLEVFYGDFRALHGVGLAVDEGRTVSIIGANGAGKSTLLKAITGLETQKKGAIRYAGEDVTTRRADLLARSGMTMVPEGRRLFPGLSVEDNLRMGAESCRKGPWTLEEVYRLFPPLKELRGVGAGRLSGGQQQMVSIGRALMTNPRLLLCDEISLGLAPKVIQDIYRCFDAVKQSGVSVVLIEQNVTLACASASYIYCLLEGRVSLEGDPARLSMPEISAAYFGTETSV